MNKTVFILLLMFGTIASIHVLPFQPIVGYAAAKVISSILFLVMAYQLFRAPMERKILWSAVFLFIILRLSFIATHPIGSDDIFRYLWDGRVQAASINPYLYAPNAPELTHLHTATLPSLVNQPQMQTLYFPLSEWIFYLSYLISGVNFLGYKLILFAAEMLTLFGLINVLEHQKIDKKYLLLFFACPLMIFEYSIDAHVDIFGLMFIVFFLWFYLRGKLLPALFFLGCSFSIKPAALVILPALFFHGRSWKERTMIAFIPLAVVGTQFLPYVFDGDIFVSLRTFTKHWTFNGFFFNVFNLYFQNNQPSRITAAIFLFLFVAFVNIKQYPLMQKVYLSMLGLFLFSPVVHPWYIGWIGILVPLIRRPSGVYYIAAAGLTVITPLYFQLFGIWKDFWPVLAVEYLPVLYFLQQELRQKQSALSPENTLYEK